MGRKRSGTRLILVFLVGGCATPSTTIDEPAAASVIRELTVTSSDANAECASMLWPVDGALSSGFGRRDGKAHDGIDLAVAEDTPVRAACDGIVAYAGNGVRGYGNLVILNHAGRLATLYAHNRELVVRPGDAVARGQLIARSGATGHVTAPHLHFEVRKDSIARDPLGYLPAK